MDNTPQSRMQQFRQEVYHAVAKRADGFMDLLDAMTQAERVESPVALSLSTAFRRRYPSVYDVLGHSVLDKEKLRALWYRYQAGVCEPMAGYEVYALDVTLEARPQARCLPERILQRPSKEQAVVACHRYSWLVGLVRPGSSWVAPQDVWRIGAGQKPCEVASEQVQALERRSSRDKVVVADSNYANKVYLEMATDLKTVSLLVRLRNNQALYGEPEPKEGCRRVRKHGAQLKLGAVEVEADEEQWLEEGERRVRLRVYRGYHLKNLAGVKGTVVQALHLRPDGTPVFKYPLWLFWTGKESLSPEVILQLYRWRFGIEHAFRFMKQHLGLEKANVTTLGSAECWMWLVGLSYWQLLLGCELVEGQVRPWQRQSHQGHKLPWTPRQVQGGMYALLVALGTPALDTRPAGKGAGRARGFHPRPRERYPLLKGAKRVPKAA